MQVQMKIPPEQDFKFQCYIKFTSKQRMDPNQQDNASQPTVPSERGDLVSNLSTMPNLSEQNDPGFEDVVNNQRQSDSQQQREHAYPLYSQRVVNNRSSSFDQLNNPHPSLNSAPPILNQVQFNQQRKENTPMISSQSSRKSYKLTTFDEGWERQLKERQAQREKIFEENEPLLSQRSQIDHYGFINVDNEPLLSQKTSQNFHQSLNHQNDSLITQQGDPGVEHPLQAIHESTEEKSQASRQVSNQARFYDLMEPAQPSIQKALSQHRSQSTFSEVDNREPLFQSGQIDQSQSNLLKFGFKIIKNSRQPLNQNQSNFSDSINQTASVSQRPPPLPDSSSPHQSQDKAEKITIRVSDCESQNLNSVKKNNDIYGILPQQESHNIHNELLGTGIDKPKNQQSYQENSRNDYNAQDETKLQEFSVKLDNIDNQNKEESQQNHQNIFQKNPQKKYQEHVNPQPQESEPNLTIQQIAQQMEKILHSEGSGVQLTERGLKLLRKHIDFLFIRPLSDIGKQIMRDGKTAVNLIKIILLKETDEELKNILRRYLVLTLTPRISTNKQTMMDYQQYTIKQSKRNPIVVESATNVPSQEDMYLSAEPARSVHIAESVDHSVHAQDGSSAKKNNRQTIQIDDAQREPVKRTIPTKMLTNSHHPSPRSGKVTRKAKNKSKVKGKTTSKKGTVQFKQPSQNHIVNTTTESMNSIDRKRSQSQVKNNKEESVGRSSSRRKREIDGLQPQDPDIHLGSKFTFVFKENSSTHNKQLVQKRVSQRLAGKSSAQKIHNLQISEKSRPRRKSPRNPNANGYYHLDQIDFDYVKRNLRHINIKTFMMERDYDALTKEDEEIIKLLRTYDEIQDEESRLSQMDNSEYDSADANNFEETMSVRSHTHSIQVRKQEFKKNIQKYKVGDIPLIILRIVDPDINNHGIYALLELGRLSQEIHHARYALTPITNLERANKRHIDVDLDEARRLVGKEEKDNIVYLKPTASMLDEIQAQKRRRQPTS